MKSVLAFAAAVGIASTAQAQLINEFRPNPTGADPATTTVELIGTAGTFYSGVLLALESDTFGGMANGSINNFGLQIEAVSGTFDANGLLTVTVTDLENPSFTLVLADAFSGGLLADLDLDNNGSIDAGAMSMFTNIRDAINISDSTFDNFVTYGSDLGGTNMLWSGDEPMLTFRDGTTQQWWSINDPAGSKVYNQYGVGLGGHAFDMDPTMATFGAVNASIPAPGAAALLGLGGLMAGRRRRA